MNRPEDKAEQMLRTIIKSLCKHTEEPMIRFKEATMEFIVAVDSRDQGRLVGKDGKTIWAIGTALWFAGLACIKRPIGIQLVEPKVRAPRTPSLFKSNSQWNKTRIIELVRAILQACMGVAAKPCSILSHGDAVAVIHLDLDVYLRAACRDPSLEEAIDIIIHAAGMVDGANLKTQATWT